MAIARRCMLSCSSVGNVSQSDAMLLCVRYMWLLGPHLYAEADVEQRNEEGTFAADVVNSGLPLPANPSVIAALFERA